MTASSNKPGTPSTMSTGAPAPSDRNSLTIGADGPIVLHDVHFLEQMAHFNREKTPERQPHAKGSGAFGVFETTEDVSRLHQGRAVPEGRLDRDARALLDRRRRAGQPRHLARRARLLAEILHQRRQLRPRRQQHAGVLRARSDEVPALHPQPEAAAGFRPARQPHAVGFLDQQSGERAPGHLSDGRARPAAHLAPDERLRLAHLYVDQRLGREILGQVSLPHPPGHGVLQQCGSRAMAGADADFHRRDLFEAIDARRASESGRCRSRSCPTTKPRPTASTRST